MSDQEDLIALRRLAELEARAAQSTPTPAPAVAPAPQEPAVNQNATLGQGLADIGKRALLGATSLVTGPLQLGANLGTTVNRNVVAPVAEALGATNVARRARDYGSTVADAVNEQLQQQQDAKRKAMAAAGNSGTDVAGIVGAVLPAVASGGASVGGSLLRRALGGAGGGAFYGATAPVTDGGENFWTNKAAQTAAGAALGGALPLAGAAVRRAASGLHDAYDVIVGSPNGIDRLKQEYYKKLIGEPNIPSVIKSLDTADPLIAGGKPTAAEAVSNNPYGTAVQAQQKVTAGTPGGISGDFNSRLYMQEVARRSAELERDAVTAPMREAALAKVNRIDRPALMQDVAGVLAAPETQAVPPARTFLSNVATAVSEAKTPQELYGVRKYITDLIDKRIDSPENVAGYAGTQLQAIKRSIDKALENGGAGGDWGKYLSTYAAKSQAIDASAERSAGMYAPRQATVVPNANDIAGGTATHLPSRLSLAASVANWGARAARSNVEPKIDASMAQDFLDPGKLADVLRRATPPQQIALKRTLEALSSIGTPTAGPRLLDQEQQ